MADRVEDNNKYFEGFGNHFCSEALPDALPKGQNSPQKCPYGLFAEQLSGTAFTIPRSHNQRSWLYRIRPSVIHTPFKDYDGNSLFTSDFTQDCKVDLNQTCWNPFDLPGQGSEEGNAQLNFVQGIRTAVGAGSPACRSGMGIHIYIGNRDMEKTAFCNADGDMMIVPQQGALEIQTEFGKMIVRPNEIAVIQRGMRYLVRFLQGDSRGYILETYGAHFELPDLGPIGANGLANPRDFLTPTACYEKREEDWTIIQKFNGKLFQCTQKHSPFDVVAWHGDYAPFKYDLARFVTINTVSCDHIDPSIFTVLTVKSNTPGQAVVDFVIFPPRWAVAQHTFRPPYFHRNDMSEFMGLILGSYEAKGNLKMGGATLHSAMTPHGPDAATFKHASEEVQKPAYICEGTQSFMWETSHLLSMTEWAHRQCMKRQDEYYKVWSGIEPQFDPTCIDPTQSTQS